MSPPRVRAMLERRILVNYRIEPDALETVVPAPFRPVLIDGHGIAGICLIRLGRIRPAGFPAAWLSSENAAHRIAVERSICSRNVRQRLSHKDRDGTRLWRQRSS